ncbi:hypothetical protein IEQ34_021107 [Dendrobium chrysotoxum]|uniref:Uncharacterized protein n=1 Tax=Dendrobium chrysotoxum TaxID=161865 RepID=A0AAV7G2P4_DENCH|nr:hypothetical protein IEQ34_021107 [Dendrobium chrysotoxum]
MANERSMEEGSPPNSKEDKDRSSTDNDHALNISVPFLHKIIAEILGTFFIIFTGYTLVIVNKSTKGSVMFPGISVVWVLVLAVMINSVGHFSGAHFNPAVTISFATCQRFPWKQVPAYIAAQVLGSTLASGMLHLLFGGWQELFPGIIPTGLNVQSLILEFIISFYLMFLVSGLATVNRAIGEHARTTVGATVLLNVGFAGLISGASMNPARGLGPAIIGNRYGAIWVYMVGPICGTIIGAWAYNLICRSNKPLRELKKSVSFPRSLKMNGSK